MACRLRPDFSGANKSPVATPASGHLLSGRKIVYNGHRLPCTDK